MRLGLTGCALVLLVQPAMALAQTAGTTPPKLEHHDIAAVLGRSAADHSSEAEFYDSWFDTWSFGLTAGHYWTDHRKTEFGFSFTGEPHEAEVSLAPTNGYVDRAIRRHTASVVQVHQFFRNATFHPFVGAGVDVNWDRWLKTTVEYDQNGPVRTTAEAFTRLSARPVGLVGFKAYVGERGFVRGEVSANVWPDAGSVVFRIGGGIDF
jgi:outer membrane protein W